MRLPRRSLLLAAVVATLAPASAHAVPVVSKPDGQTILVQSTTPGEHNQIATEVVGDELRITESLAGGITAGLCTQIDAITARCSTAGVTRLVLRLGPGDDEIIGASHTLRQEIFGEAGDDALMGGAGDDLVDGGPGVDEALGADGDDLLQMEDGAIDAGYDCGTGDDDADHDLHEPYGDWCETYAPEFRGAPAVLGMFQSGGGLVAANIRWATDEGAQPTETAVRWLRCETGGACALASGDVWSGRYALRDWDVGRTFVAEVVGTNRAGTKSILTAPTPPIAARAVAIRRPTVHPPRNLGLDVWNADLAGALKASLATVGRTDIRRLARRRSTRLRFAFPWSASTIAAWRGPLTVTWTVPAKVARRYGYRGRRKKSVTVASGRSTRRVTPTMSVHVKPTAIGRRILRRAKRLRIEIDTRIRVGVMRYPDLTAKRRLTVRRR